jgi:phosphoribosylaminoimidazole-succinocarboxamide synthase
VIMGEPIPGKGELLTQMALFWFDKLGHICPNHLTGEAPSVVKPEEVAQVRGRSMLVSASSPCRSRPWCAATWPAAAGRNTRNRNRSAACPARRPDQRRQAARAHLHPAAKAAVGDHDENITFERTVEMVGLDWPPASAT